MPPEPTKAPVIMLPPRIIAMIIVEIDSVFMTASCSAFQVKVR